MPASLAQLTTNTARLERHFPDGESFFIEYRPADMTPRQMHLIQANKDRRFSDLTPAEQAEALDAITRVLANLLVATDATTSAGEPIVCTYEGLQDVSYTDQTALLDLIIEDQRLGKTNETENSPASSTPISVSITPTPPTASHLSPNGTATNTSPNGSVSVSQQWSSNPSGGLTEPS